MSVLDFKNEGGTLTALLSGKIDSSNAPEVEQEISAVVTENNHEFLVIDALNLEYISSAGLRIILRLRKNEPELKIIHASSEVYDIFEMTGFTEMIPVSKAYREISVDGCEVIGKGANGEVYRIDADTIVKVYINPDSLPDIQRERELARKAFILGIPTAIPYDVVKVGSGYGSVFELLNAKSLAKLVMADTENIDKYVGLYVDLLKKIHSTQVKPEDMPDMRETAVNWAKFVKEYLPEGKGKKLVKLVEDVPVDYHMMHGDYHLKNVMMQNGEVLLIDMDTICYGHPIFEFASIFNAYIGFGELDYGVTGRFLGIPYDICHDIWEKTLALYFNNEDKEKIEEVKKKSMIVGYTRLIRRLIRRNGLENEQSRAEIEYYINNLINLLDEVDTLTF